MVAIEIQALHKSFTGSGNTKDVLRSIDVSILKSEVVAIRGDNGCGKTTLLNLIAGLESPTQGTIHLAQLNGESIRVGYVQQDYTSSLLPWYDVLDNVSIPLRLQGHIRSKRRQEAERLLDFISFNNLPFTAYPHQLSGGQKQRIAVARALIHNPHLLLLDEPFANLDAHTSRDLQNALSRIHEAKQPTILYVSHDLDHSIYLADRVLLLHGSPARLVSDIQIALPRPRRREMIFSPAYAEIRSRILIKEEALYAEGQ